MPHTIQHSYKANGEINISRCALSILVLLFTLQISAAETMDKPEKIESDEFKGVLASAGNILVSGQPTEDGFEWAKEQGVTTVITVRRQEELDDREAVPFDEAAKLKALGLEFIHIPLGGDDHPYTPAALNAFAKAVESADGKVLLHCTVGWRASHLWAAYMVKYQGMQPEAAIEQARQINLGKMHFPMLELLDADVEIKLPEKNQ